MPRLRMTSDEARGAGGGLRIGRGYQLVGDDGSVVARDALRPSAADEAGDDPAGGPGTDLAVARVRTSTPEQQQALTFPAFGVDRLVTLRATDEGVAVLDADGARQAGWIADEDAAAVTARLGDAARPPATWVCWEWLSEAGRAGIEVALSSPELVPGPLGAPPAGRGGSAGAGAVAAVARDRRVWAALAGVLVLVAVGFAGCG